MASEIQPETTATMDDDDYGILGESITKDYQQFVQNLYSGKDICRNQEDEYYVEKGVNLSEILARLSASIPRPNNSSIATVPDTYTHIAILSQSIQGYLKIIEKACLESISERINSDTTKWLSTLYGVENMASYFHDKSHDGLVKVCKLALHARYTKYASDGFTSLYTRPPVIYFSAAAPSEFGKTLRSELGLPQSSMCSVPCNTMFGSPYTMDVSSFERLLTDDVSCGKTPLILIAYAGTPTSGHTDNLSRLREICTQSGVWFHVEGDTLANLTLSQAQPSIQAATTADSLTMNYSKWYGIPNLPYCTFYQTNNIGMAHSAGLIPDAEGMLKALPIWLMVQFMGTQDLRAIIEHASGLSQQMSNRLDVISTIKRVEQPTGLSPVVIFKYTAIVSATAFNKSENVPLLQQGLKIEASPNLCDKFNAQLAEHVKSICKNIVVDQITIPLEGVCLRFDPLQTCRVNKTSRDDVNNLTEILQNKVTEMNCTLGTRTMFKNLIDVLPDVILIDVSEEPVLGAFQCIPSYWKTKTMTNLSDLKKEEANELNSRLYEELLSSYKFIDRHVLSSGQICIIVGMIDESLDLHALVDKISMLTVDLQDNSKFVDSVKESVEEGIRIAQEKLSKEKEEKLMQEGIIRNVPLVSSIYNWLLPLPDGHGIVGQSFDLSSGRLDKTESVHKYKIQMCDDQSETASYISRKSAPRKSLECDAGSISGESSHTESTNNVPSTLVETEVKNFVESE